MKKRSKAIRSRRRLKVVTETSAGAVVFLVEHKIIKILALVQNNPTGEEWFDMPKGHVKRNESLVRAAQREMREEIGISPHLDTNFQHETSYSFVLKNKKTGMNERVSKRVIFFLAFIHKHEKKEIVLSPEHKRYYLMPIDEAIRKAKFQNQKELLRDAQTYITLEYLT